MPLHRNQIVQPYGKIVAAVEGLDASGKATQCKLLAHALGAAVLAYPDYTNFSGAKIKELFVKAATWGKEDPTLYGVVMQALQTVNRLENADGMWDLIQDGPVVFDRYIASAFAYGLADGLDLDWLRQIVPNIPMPDVQILIDIPVEESFRRRPEREDAYEADFERLERARQNYLTVFKIMAEDGGGFIAEGGSPTRWHIIDGCGTIQEVHDRILSAVIPNP